MQRGRDQEACLGLGLELLGLLPGGDTRLGVVVVLRPVGSRVLTPVTSA